MKHNISETSAHGFIASPGKKQQDKPQAHKHKAYIQTPQSNGLADLQQTTSNILSHTFRRGFGNSKLKVKRHKLDNNIWQLTVMNPRTRKTILQAEGHGDIIFAYEDNLALMAETLIAQGLTIRTHFDD